MSTDVFVLLDLRGLILHAYHSGNDPEASDPKIRTPEHTLHNFTERYLKPVLQLVPLNHIIAVNDAGAAFRKALNAEYKATRTEPEPEIKQAMELSRVAVRELLHSLGILQCHVPGTEADDVIAYLVGRLPGQKIIYTVDGDLTALANSHTTVLLKDQPAATYTCKYDATVNGVKQKRVIDVLPRHVSLFKSIVGDSSDNIAGVKGMGPAVWEKLVAEFGLDGLDELVAIIEDESFVTLRNLAESQQHPLLVKLSDNLAQWRNSYQLARLRPELVDGKQGKKFTRIEWDKRLPSKERLEKLQASANAYWLMLEYAAYLPYQELVTAEKWDDSVLPDLEALFKTSRFVALDWETWAPTHKPFKEAGGDNYVDMLSSRITGMGITCGDNLQHTFYFQFEHADEQNNIDKNALPQLLARIPQGVPIVAQNAIFEATVYGAEFGALLPGLQDTKIMHSHVDEGTSSGLKDMSKRYLNYDQTRYDQVVEPGKTMKDYTGQHVFKYGADDPLVTAHLYDLFRIILLLEGTWEFVRDNEFAMVYQLSDAFLAGVSIDFDEVERQRLEDQQTYDTNMSRVRDLLEANVNAETIRYGAENWMAMEIIPNIRAESKFVIRQIAGLLSKPGPLAAIKEDKLLANWVGDVAAVGLTFSDYQDAVIEETRNRIRLVPGNDKHVTEWDRAVAAATYVPFRSNIKPGKFQFSVGRLNQLAEHFGLPAWPVDITSDNKAALIEAGLSYKAHLPEGATTAQKHYVDMVIETSLLSKAVRSKSDPYGYLRDIYVALFNGGVEKEGTELNLDSPKQMQELLYAMLGLPIRIRAFEPSKGRELRHLDGAAQTNKDAIATAIAYGDAQGWQREVLELVTEAKACLTRIKFFYNKLPLWRHPVDGLVHPQFNSTGTETRRPSGSHPNFLQLSKKGEGKKVRRCVIPNTKLGHDLICAIDWSAQELRLIAGLSRDDNMLACYVGNNLLDVHSVTAAYMLGIPYAQFIAGRKGADKALAKTYDDVRGIAKNVNFGSSYGIGKHKLARQLVFGSKQVYTPDAAQEFLDAKRAAFPQIEVWKADVKNFLHAKGYIRTLFGTVKHVFNKILTSDEGMVGYLERAAVNQLIQGVCADYLKKVLADMWKARTFERHGAVLVAPIYDELVFSCHSSQAIPLILEVYQIMVQGVPGLPVPMLAMPSLGINFGDQIEVLDSENDDLTAEKIAHAIQQALYPVSNKEAA